MLNNPRSLVMAVVWLAILGAVVLLATKFVGRTAAKAASVTPL